VGKIERGKDRSDVETMKKA